MAKLSLMVKIGFMFEQLPREVETLSDCFRRFEHVRTRLIGCFGRFFFLLRRQLAKKLLTELSIASCRKTQDFVANAPTVGDGRTAALGLLLSDFLLCDTATFRVDGFGGVPRLTKHRAPAFRIGIPKCISNPGLRPRALVR